MIARQNDWVVIISFTPLQNYFEKSITILISNFLVAEIQASLTTDRITNIHILFIFISSLNQYSPQIVGCLGTVYPTEHLLDRFSKILEHIGL